MTSNKSKPDLFLPLPLNWGANGWMDEQIQCIPSQDPMFTKSDRRGLFTRLHSSWSQCNYKIVQHATFWKKQKSSGFVASSCCCGRFFFMSCFEHSVQLWLSSLQHKKTNRLLKSILSIKISAAWTKRIWDPVFRAPGYYSNKAHYIKSFCRRAC